jgi:hypothetical protein
VQRISRRSCIAGLLGAAAAAVFPTAAPAAAEAPRAPIRDPSHTFEGYVTSWRELQRRNVVMQQYDYS